MESVILADNNSNFVLMYQQVQKHPRIIAEKLARLPRTKAMYYEIRSSFNEERDPTTHAAHLLYLNRHAFNAVYRVNRRGHFNVPFGDNTGAVPDARLLYRCSYALREAAIRCQDFRDTADQFRAGDFVYLDPPYVAHRKTYGEYGYASYGEADEPSLISAMRRADNIGATVLLSYAGTPEFTSEFSNWSVISITRRRQIAPNNEHRRDYPELLMSNRIDIEARLRGSKWSS